MRRNRIRTRLDKNIKLERKNDGLSLDTFERIRDDILLPDINGYEYHNLKKIMEDDDCLLKPMSLQNPITDFFEVHPALQKISHAFKQEDLQNHLKNIRKMRLNDIDPDFDYRFINRPYLKNIDLPPVKTRLKWQKGENPFFRADVRYYNKEQSSFLNKRKTGRSIKCYTKYDMMLDRYVTMSLPDNEWPCQGKLYVTNLKIFYKYNKEQRFSIHFNNVISYHFFDNALLVEHVIHGNIKSEDVFYLESEQARLLEAIIRITI